MAPSRQHTNALKDCVILNGRKTVVRLEMKNYVTNSMFKRNIKKQSSAGRHSYYTYIS